MTAVIEVEQLRKVYGGVTAIDGVSFRVEEHRIHGLLGRNGAGKTTLMKLIAAHEFATDGQIRVFGESPVENARVLERLCFVRESPVYPEDWQVRHVFRSAPWFFGAWDVEFADHLIEDFRLPLKRPIRALSRGQLSAIGVIVGLASRAPLTFFDEPYLGLDAVARQLFYDRLLGDYGEHPRTIVLSTHLIDEVSNLLEHVFLLDGGRLVLDQPAEELRGSATTIVGRAAAVDAFAQGFEVLHRDAIGGLASVTIAARLDDDQRDAATAGGLELAPVSLQQLIVRLTSGTIPRQPEEGQ